MPIRLLLHVDDDDDEAFLLRRMLERSGIDNWNMIHRACGEDAITYLQRACSNTAVMPDLVLLDIKMPGMGGLRTLEWATENVPEVPVIMMSSSDQIKDQLRARDLGSVGYYEKTPSFSEILEVLRQWDHLRYRRRRR